MNKRRYELSVGRDGWHLDLYTRSTLGVLAEKLVDKLLIILGHPCCGRGVGRLDWVGLTAWRLTNWSINVGNRKQLESIKIKEDTARLIDPEFVNSINSREEEDFVQD